MQALFEVDQDATWRGRSGESSADGVRFGLMTKKVDWRLLGRYALLISLTVWIPIPLLDQGIENLLRRRLVRALARRHGAELDDEAVEALGNRSYSGCMGCFWSVVLWPIKKLLKSIVAVFQIKEMADLGSDVVHRGLLLEEAFEAGWLPGEAPRVREAMDRAVAKVDTRVVERAVRGTFRDHSDDLTRVVAEATRVARERAKGHRGEALADAADAGALGETAEEMSSAMTAALQGTGIVPELIQWFRAEMGREPRLESRMGGLLEASELLPADEEPATGERLAIEGPLVEEAVEVEAKPKDGKI
jgi:hypothetical protein